MKALLQRLWHRIALRLRHRPALQFLHRRGADALPHSDTTLSEHLCRVHLLLRAWGADRDVAAAALLHSIYGTEFLADAVAGDAERADVRRLIGERAESLVWLWHSLVRTSLPEAATRAGDPFVLSRLSGERMPITRTQLVDLANLMIADAVEQLPRRNAAARARQRTLLTPLLPLALPEAAAAARIQLTEPDSDASP